MNDTL